MRPEVEVTCVTGSSPKQLPRSTSLLWFQKENLIIGSVKGDSLLCLYVELELRSSLLESSSLSQEEMLWDFFPIQD